MAPVSESESPIPDNNSLRSGDIANIVIGIITAVAAIIVLLIKARKLRSRDKSPVNHYSRPLLRILHADSLLVMIRQSKPVLLLKLRGYSTLRRITYTILGSTIPEHTVPIIRRLGLRGYGYVRSVRIEVHDLIAAESRLCEPTVGDIFAPK